MERLVESNVMRPQPERKLVQSRMENRQSRHNNLQLTLRPDEDFESKAAPSSLVIGDGGCGEVTQS